MKKTSKLLKPAVRCMMDDCRKAKIEAYRRWMGALNRRVDAQFAEDVAREEYSAADRAWDEVVKSP